MAHTREAAALAKNRFAAKAGRAARERLAYSHLVVPLALPPLPCPSCQRWGAAFRPDPRCACVLSLAGLQSLLLSWATLLRTRDARVVIKREKVPKGFRPVRDRSREVFRWCEPAANKKRMAEAPNGSDGYRADKQPHDYATRATSEGDPLSDSSSTRKSGICGAHMWYHHERYQFWYHRWEGGLGCASV
jgi:hypothetical protein